MEEVLSDYMGDCRADDFTLLGIAQTTLDEDEEEEEE